MEWEALKLWIRWFHEGGDPYAEDDYGRQWCFFCGVKQDVIAENHDENCIWLAAKKMIEQVKVGQL